MENDNEVIDSTTDTETTENAEDLDLDLDLDDDTEDVEALKKANATLQAQKDHWKKKATEKPPKAEEKKEEVKEDKPEPDLSSTDLYALMTAQVPQEDIEEVRKAAKLLGKTVAEALKDSVVKTILSRKAEERTTAEAANTGKARRVTNAVTADALVSDLSKGKVPEPGSKEAEDLFWARRKQQK